MFSLLIILVCLGLNALLASVEIAFVTVSKAQIRQLVRNGNTRAAKLLEFRENPERTLSILQVGITLVGAISAAAGGAKAFSSLAPWLVERYGWNSGFAELSAIVIVVLPLTYVNVVFAELVPKNIALKNPLRVSLMGTPWLVNLDRAFSPLVRFLEYSTSLVNHALRLLQRSDQVPIAVDSSIDIGSLSEPHKQFVINLVNIEHRQVRDILVPWRDANKVENTSSITEVYECVLQCRHTRLPVVSEGRVIGLLHAKEFLAFRATGATDWQQLIRPVIAILGNTPLLSALRLMQSKRSHLSIVFSREGSLLGIVTLEDIIEEIVGDIFDEDDDGTLKRLLGSAMGIRSIVGRKS